MRRALLDLLLCPRCRAGALHPPAADSDEVAFGPLRCSACAATFPVTEGVVDLLGQPVRSASRLQRSLEVPLMARSFEARLRPALLAALGGRRMDRESEWLLYRSLLGSHAAPVLDLGCGTGLFARRLARSAAFPAVIGMDVSGAMLEEAVAQAREVHVPVDLIRGRAPELPFRDGVLGGVLHADALHYLADLETLAAELHRVMAPGARYVASTFEASRSGSSLLQKAAGLTPRSENAVRSALEFAGFRIIERVRTAPYLIFVATR